MSVGNFSTSNMTFRMIMGNGLSYTVPRFQRDYSWTNEEWDDLWNDIESLGTVEESDNHAESTQPHYMGYLVLKSQDNKHFEIVDGQQRLTTLSITILAVISTLQQLVNKDQNAETNQKRMDQLRDSFIGYIDLVTQIPRSKLNLNRNDDRFYQKYLVAGERMPQTNLTASNRLLAKAYDWFKKTINKKSLNGKELSLLIEALADKLFFTVIVVNDELNAYRVFETLNSRGVRLSSTDLLKNYLFSVVYNQDNDDVELDELEKRWEELSSTLEKEGLPSFLRTHWNSRHSLTRHADLFRTIRNEVTNKQQVFALMRDMAEDADIFMSIIKPDSEQWTGTQRKHLEELRIFDVSQSQALLIAAYRALNEKDFTTILRAISIISFRYNIIENKPPNKQEKAYNDAIKHIISPSETNLATIREKLMPVYPSDEEFKSAFTRKVLNTFKSKNTKIARYILFAIEHHKNPNTQYDPNNKTYNIEHILPEHPDQSWDHIDGMEHTQLVYRLGNMTLLTVKHNAEAGNRTFNEKQAIYKRSNFHITQRIAEENAEWDSSRINANQAWLAKQAVGLWKIS